MSYTIWCFFIFDIYLANLIYEYINDIDSINSAIIQGIDLIFLNTIVKIVTTANNTEKIIEYIRKNTFFFFLSLSIITTYYI